MGCSGERYGEMRILMLLSNPFMVDPRVSREAKSLVDYGHEVTVIVWDRKGDYPTEDIIDGIRIIRIHNNLLMKILLNDLFRNPLWWRKAYKKGSELYKSGQFKFDVVHCHDLDTLWAGVWLKKKLGIKLIYDAHEIFGYMIASDMPKFIVGVALRMEKRLVKKVDHVITVNEPLRDYFRSISDKPITVVMNCKDLVSREYILPRNDVFTICYIGVLSKSRMFPEIVDTAKKRCFYDLLYRCAK
jgi:glycosyltransferase involved in cell wall biosynthesis